MLCLTKEEKNTIKMQTQQVFGKGSRVYLFGSRVRLDKKGGDIDLFIEPQNIYNELEQKMKLLTRLQLIAGVISCTFLNKKTPITLKNTIIKIIGAFYK